MKTKLLILFFILSVSIIVFVWGTVNYLIRYTDTPGQLPPELYVQNIDVFAMPAFVATFVIIGVTTVLVWMLFASHKRQIIFTSLSGVGIFFTFIGVLKLILEIRS